MFTPEQAKGLAEFLLQGASWEFETTKKVLAATPADQLGFKLGDKGRTAADLAWHIITSDLWFLDGIAALNFAGGQPPAQPATIPEMLALYSEAFPKGIEKVRAMSGEQLATPIAFFGAMNLPAAAYINFLSNHMIHHRGQYSAYLRAMNAHVPSIYGGSADEPFQSGASA